MASSNPGKLREINQILGNLGLEVVPQSDFDVPDADETGLSFVENSILKARHAAQLTGLPAIADDSGLEVDALKGAPGIYSARYSSRSGGTGPGTTDEKNLRKLLEDLKDVPFARVPGRVVFYLNLRERMDLAMTRFSTCPAKIAPRQS
jgi:XTP/dITP diphosphohydrolase